MVCGVCGFCSDLVCVGLRFVVVVDCYFVLVCWLAYWLVAVCLRDLVAVGGFVNVLCVTLLLGLC